MQTPLLAFPKFDAPNDRAEAPLIGFVVATALSVPLWVPVAWLLSELLH